jgi:hypothetical protein
MYKIKFGKTFEFYDQSKSQYTKGEIVDERFPSQDRSKVKSRAFPARTLGSASTFESEALKKGGGKNIQQQVFAGGHPPNY